jgi:hypothetical protein
MGQGFDLGELSHRRGEDLIMGSFVQALEVSIFNRSILRDAQGKPIPYPDAKERRLKRQRVYNQRYYYRKKNQI